MKIALAQINPIVGDIAGNAKQIRSAIKCAHEKGAQLVILPELAIIGYPPQDLLLKPAVIHQCTEAINDLAASCTDIAAIIGHPCPTGQTTGRPLHNAAVLCYGGQIAHRYIKNLLPTYDVFDEHRYFEPGPKPTVASLANVKMGTSICEDLWNDCDLIPGQVYHSDPVQDLAQAGAQLLVNCAASPFVIGKHDLRLALLKSAAKRHGIPAVFCNQVGGNDELVFDGNSCAVDAQGQVIAHAKDFQPDLLIVDLPLGNDTTPNPTNRIEIPSGGIESIYHTLVLGLQDYARKCGFDSAIIGVSGGIDSAVTAALTVAALGQGAVRAVAMPSRYSSKRSITDAAELTQQLGIQFDIIPITDTHDAFERVLTPYFEGQPTNATEENIQARVRGVILMALSNKFGSLLVTTGNKSELAVGYCTLYGDMAGGLAVLSDVPKTMVVQLARWINDNSASPLRKQFGKPVIPEHSITKPPSAELRPDQTDQDSLPPYEVLDQIIERYVEHQQSVSQIVDQLQDVDPDTIQRMVRLIDLNEYKRQQAAPGLKITSQAFGVGRRMPIAQRYQATP